MSQGLLNPKEKDALPVLNAIIGELVGKRLKKVKLVFIVYQQNQSTKQEKFLITKMY